MHDRLQTLRVFIRVAELKSFTRAAESLGIARTQVSTMVQQLESELGCRLLHRTTRLVRLTPDGEACYQRGEMLLNDYNDLADSFHQREQNLTGTLRIDMPLGVARLYLIPALQPLLEQNPDLQLEISSTDRKVDVVAEGFDAVLRVGKLKQEGIIAKYLGDMQQISVASSAYLTRYGEPKRINELQNHQLIRYVSFFGEHCEFDYVENGKRHEVVMPSRITVNNSDAYMEACLDHFGIIQTAKSGLTSYLENGELEQILPHYEVPSMPIYLVYPHRRHLSPRLRKLSNWLSDLIQSTPGFIPR